jgi:hypothetical protein
MLSILRLCGETQAVCLRRKRRLNEYVFQSCTAYGNHPVIEFNSIYTVKHAPMKPIIWSNDKQDIEEKTPFSPLERRSSTVSTFAPPSLGNSSVGCYPTDFFSLS